MLWRHSSLLCKRVVPCGGRNLHLLDEISYNESHSEYTVLGVVLAVTPKGTRHR